MSLADQDAETWYCEWPVDPFTREVTPDPADVRYLQKLLGNPRLEKSFFNAKFDIRMLRHAGIEVRGKIHDEGVAARICNTLEFNYQLKPLAKKYAKYSDADEKELQKEVVRCRNRARKLNWKLAEDTEADYWLPRALDASANVCERYAVGDVIRTLLLHYLYHEVVMKDEESPELFQTYQFEMEQVMPTLYEMEERGICISREKNGEELYKARINGEKELKALKSMLKRDGKTWSDNPNEELNPGSSKQLIRILFDKRHGYGLKVYRRSEKTKEPSTDWKALREHLTHPVVQTLVRWRSAQKAQSTYFGNYARLMVEDHIQPGYCIHGSFNQLGARRTSRLSSNAPNLQNVGDANNNPNSPAPIQARGPFGPRKGYVWYCLDWSGQEMRIFAFVAQIETMLEAFRTGKSVHEHNANLAWGGKDNPHALTAASYSLELGSAVVTKPSVLAVWDELGWDAEKARIFGFNSDEAQEAADEWLSRFNYDICKAEESIGLKRVKTRAKNLGFAKIYGSGVNGVIDMLYCTRQEAREMLKRIDEVFPGIPIFSKELSRQAKHDGYIHNLYGRRLNVDAYSAYKSVNYLVQGTAADMMKRSVVRCHQYLKSTGLDAHIVMSIHDEIVFEIRMEHAYKWLLRGLQMIMESAGDGAVGVEMPVEISRVRHYWDHKEAVTL